MSGSLCGKSCAIKYRIFQMIIEIIKMYEGRENLGVLAIKMVKVRSVKSLCGEEKKKW
jgi:hypothetical protein